MKKLIYNHLEAIKGNYFNSFIGNNINRELLLDIWDIDNTTCISNETREFKEKTNLAYLGEVLERFEERDLVHNQSDLNTLIMFTYYSFQTQNPNTNTNQLKDFMKKAETVGMKNKDLFSLSLLLNLEPHKNYVSSEKLYSLIIEELENEMDFELKLWAAYYCWNYLNIQINAAKENDDISKLVESKNNLLSAISNIEIKPLLNHEDYYLYGLITEINIHEQDFFKSSKNFRIKSICNQHKKLLSLFKKECKEDTIDSLEDVLNISKEDLYLYNYLLAINSDKLSIKTGVTSKGFDRLLCKIGERFSKPEKISHFIFDILRNELNFHDEYKTIARCNKVFGDFSERISVKNFSLFIDLIRLNSVDHEFIQLTKYNYIFDDEYVLFLNKMSSSLVKRLSLNCIAKSDNLTRVKNAYDYFISKKYAEHLLDNMQIKNLYITGVLEDINPYLDKGFNHLKGYILFKKEKLPKLNYIEFLKECYKQIESNECLKHYSSKHGANYTYNITAIFLDYLDDFKSCDGKLDEDELTYIRESQIFKESLLLLKLNTVEYFHYIAECLKDEDYANIMGLSQDNINEILRDIYDFVKNNKSLDSYNCRVLINELEKTLLSEYDIEINKLNEYFDRFKESSSNIRYYLGDFLKNLSKDKPYHEKYIKDSKKLFFESVFATDVISSTDYIFKIAGRLNDLGVLNSKDLLNLGKFCMKNCK